MPEILLPSGQTIMPQTAVVSEQNGKVISFCFYGVGALMNVDDVVEINSLSAKIVEKEMVSPSHPHIFTAEVIE